MSMISLRVPESELTLIKNYARLKNVSVSEVFRDAVLSRIEDEFDKQVFLEFEQDLQDNKISLRPFENLLDECGL